MESGRTGRVILVHGPSSSGKTAIARALLPLLPDPWFHVPVDAVNAMRSPTPGISDDELAEVLRRTRLGYHRVVAGLAAAGNDVVMDYPLSEPWRLDDLLEVLAPYDVTLVEVRCDLDVLEVRERDRGDRPEGLARSQARGYDVGEADVVVDTTVRSALACATAVADALPGLPTPKAFDRLRAARRDPGTAAKTGP
jgi:chloramphenicol 3-O phosphotransferase